ncbi:mannose-binding lectin [Paenibacillus mucilaginosus 3016]|uniref:Mannose-binding lectin n=2 Tax=Paenibacillus mucilaginosus TaxID=61624 RepID=H6NH04_9BACL|nr:mannose-binding lectin [Paenibacillus mucilaginosus 3016]
MVPGWVKGVPQQRCTALVWKIEIEKRIFMKKFTLLLLAVFMLQFSIVTAASAKNSLLPGEKLTAGQMLVSNNGRFALVMQTDGNLVLYQDGGNPIWDTNTDDVTHSYYDPYYRTWRTVKANTLVMTSTLTLESSVGKGFGTPPFWHSNIPSWMRSYYPSNNMPPLVGADSLWVQDDGNVVLYSTTTSRGTYPVWASNTGGR